MNKIEMGAKAAYEYWNNYPQSGADSWEERCRKLPGSRDFFMNLASTVFKSGVIYDRNVLDEKRKEAEAAGEYWEDWMAER